MGGETCNTCRYCNRCIEQSRRYPCWDYKLKKAETSTTSHTYNLSERGGDMKDTVIAVNSLNVEKAFEALARILTARGEATVTVKSIKKKDEVQKDETA